MTKLNKNFVKSLTLSQAMKLADRIDDEQLEQDYAKVVESGKGEDIAELVNKTFPDLAVTGKHDSVDIIFNPNVTPTNSYVPAVCMVVSAFGVDGLSIKEVSVPMVEAMTDMGDVFSLGGKLNFRCVLSNNRSDLAILTVSKV